MCIRDRVYKAAIGFDEAREIVAKGRGTQFDPAVADAFLDDFETFVEIARCHAREAPACQTEPAADSGAEAPGAA